MSQYEPVIGLEIHVALNTKSKLFCGCDNNSVGAAPNTNICPVCFGLPGALPVLNRRAVELAIMFGLAIEATIPETTKFDRKHYFYPDSPKGYQISQYDEPIVANGKVDIYIGDNWKTIRVNRIHLEDDAGKLIHPDGADYSLVDLNRAGTPLLEIVSEPDLASAEEAKQYMHEIHNIARFLGVSGANMELGEMRCDANVSLRPAGQTTLGTRTETKNLNSFRMVERAIKFEIARQTEILSSGGKINQETRSWNDTRGTSSSLRSKENSSDYRYFPDPDLPPLKITAAMRDAARAKIPVLPTALRREMMSLGLGHAEAEVLITNSRLLDLYQQTKAAEGQPQLKRIVNWLITDVQANLGPKTKDKLSSTGLIELARMVESNQLSSTSAKEVLTEMMAFGQAPKQIAEAKHLIQVSDVAAITTMVEAVLKANPEAAADFKAGKEQILGFLVGQVMKQSRGQANPELATKLIKEILV